MGLWWSAETAADVAKSSAKSTVSKEVGSLQQSARSAWGSGPMGNSASRKQKVAALTAGARGRGHRRRPANDEEEEE